MTHTSYNRAVHQLYVVTVILSLSLMYIYVPYVSLHVLQSYTLTHSTALSVSLNSTRNTIATHILPMIILISQHTTYFSGQFMSKLLNLTNNAPVIGFVKISAIISFVRKCSILIS